MRNGKRILSLALLVLLVLLVVLLMPVAAHADPPKGDTHLHSWSVVSETPATCTSPGTKTWRCSACGDTYTEQTSPPLGHDFGNGRVTREATCTKEGEKTWTCSRCGATKTDTFPAKGHSPVSIPAVAPTCTETGLTEGSKCETCGEILTPQETVPALGHAPVTIPGVEPTCTETGLTEGEKCDRCGAVLKAQETVPALGHAPVTIPGSDPTCEADGYTDGETCDRCGFVLKEREVLPAIGHAWDEGAVTTEPSGFTPGVRTFTCKNDPSHTRTEEIDPAPWLFATFTGSIPDFTTFDLATKDLTPLTITEQPQDGAVTRHGGDSLTLHVAATGGTGDYTYEWKYRPTYNSTIGNIISWTFLHTSGKQTEPVFEAYDGNMRYWCVVTDSAGNTAQSETAIVSYKLGIAKQPDNANLQPTGKATLSCLAEDGSGSYSYRWIDNQDNEIDVGSSIDVTEIGDYMCIATDDLTGESVSSYACQVYSIDPFRLVNITESCEVLPEEETFVVASFAGGVEEYEIWWDKNGTAIDSVEGRDEVDHVYSLANVDGPGVYTVHGVDSMYATASGTVTISAPKLTIVEQPVGGTIPKDKNLELNVKVAGGKGPYYYTAYRNGVEYAIGETDTPQRFGFRVWYPGEYYMHIEDSQGREADSDVVTFEASTFRIKKQSNAGALYTATDTFTLYVEVEGGKEPYTYEWMQYRGDTPWYTKASDTDTCIAKQPGKYACLVTDATGDSIHSKNMFVLYNGPKPRIIKQPSGLTLTPDEKGHFSFSLSCEAASGNGDESCCLAYKWERYNPDGYWSYAGSEKTMTHSLLGSYRCKVIDVISKEYTYTKTVTVAEAVTASADVNMIRYGGRVGDMEANLTIKGGSAPYTIKVYEVIDVWSEDGRIIDERTVLYKTYADKTAEEVQGFYFTFPPNQQIFIKENGEWKSYMDYIKVYAIITDADGRSTRVNLTGYSG